MDMIRKYVLKGYRMPKPEKCPDNFYQLMIKCWSSNPSNRPRWSQLRIELQKLLAEVAKEETSSLVIVTPNWNQSLLNSADQFAEVGYYESSSPQKNHGYSVGGEESEEESETSEEENEGCAEESSIYFNKSY
jgi:hypothetical protein